MKVPHKRAKKLPKTFHPPLAISVHGIRTRGVWQKEFAAVMSGTPTKTESFDYGTYGLLRFLTPGVKDQKINEFYAWYSEKVQSNPRVKLDRYDRRPSVVAHSLGSWIVAHAMLRFDDIRFDKIIMAGSILKTDFDWATLFARGQVSQVVNECGKRDPWPKFSSLFVAKTGTAGRDGFRWFESCVRDEPYEFGHSDAVLRAHIQSHWVPILNAPPVAKLSLVHGREIGNRQLFSDWLDHTGTVIDAEAYGHLPDYPGVEIPRGLSLEWIRINPDIYTFLVDQTGNSPAGYLNAMPLDEACYGSIRNEKLNDNQVPAEALLEFDGPRKVLKVYLMSVAIEESYRNTGQGINHYAYVQLLTGFLDKLKYYAEKYGTKVSHFLATAWTAEGLKICESLSMTKVGENKYGLPIYEVDLEVLRRDPEQNSSLVLKHLLKTYALF